ncbi:alpha/beta hydrolase [Pseudomonas helleri]|jgi:pimeloyl-ACP methyl ester carboxylesterase|uniref:Alpha/beta fold hydrolase n=2 Tax=Pseudomonas TaxID=286 RepID=A0A0J6L1D3_9PSED|nr:alpha/beta fold hydrolase [Pseudomonas helleri]KMN08066.1 alpha/beta hydrolase [Pseudomonas helleri]MQT77244.1 alpha/beta fold hydrolase [Pseudomonas helleri]MQT97583.1 alpha/beta fold hydrolase [Pseudomonas helleri]MQU06793.1 alpha/beta fold hydrolase [Pseudomonas helleri]MQU33358.1 alpha/beta fold hydrolase [Pseudomonas helleri]
MMLRILLLVLTLFGTQAFAATQSNVLLRPIELDTGSGTLYGSLVLPKSDKPVPVVLLIAGSGPTDRDGNNPIGGRNDSLKKLAWRLAQNNIASVRFDKRGIAQSQPAAPDERQLSVDQYVNDAVAWGDKLKADPRFGKVFLLGHSEGALIAVLAAPRIDAAGVISIAGSGRPVGQLLREQLQRNNLPPALLKRSFELIASLEAGHTDDNVPPALEAIFRPSVQPYLISLLRYNPAKAFAALKMPAMIIQGTHDIQVEVKDARLLKAAKPDASLTLVHGMNHVMRIVPMDIKRQVLSYNDPNQRLAGEVGDRIVRFIAKVNAAQPSSPAHNGR